MKHKSILGQNFLVDTKTIDNIVELARIGKEDVVYEVGTGNGALTKKLCKISRFVHSFELDSKVYERSKKLLKFENLELFNLDGLNEKLNIQFDVFFSSLPYYESRRALSWLCQKRFKRGIILLQREFVEKLLSKPGEENYRAISILSQYRFSITVLLKVPASSFSPKPKVDSLLVEICPKISPLDIQIINDIQFLFSFRKKTVSFVLKYYKKHYKDNLDISAISDIASIRIAQLTPVQILRLNNWLKNNLFF
jgi:16S rRNA (adenine1518-N6/adenine1519-N6)-dimethyltransferase